MRPVCALALPAKSGWADGSAGAYTIIFSQPKSPEPLATHPRFIDIGATAACITWPKPCPFRLKLAAGAHRLSTLSDGRGRHISSPTRALGLKQATGRPLPGSARLILGNEGLPIRWPKVSPELFRTGQADSAVNCLPATGFVWSWPALTQNSWLPVPRSLRCYTPSHVGRAWPRLGGLPIPGTSGPFKVYPTVFAGPNR
jgi:hypothetical protein